MFGRSQKQKQHLTKAKITRHQAPTNEEIIQGQLVAANDELAATKLHLEAERNGRIAAHNQLHAANLRIDQLLADNYELRHQLQQTQDQLDNVAIAGPNPGPLKKLINALPTNVQTELNFIPQLYSNGRGKNLISDLTLNFKV